jgi:cytoskeleton protein RodZ
MNRLLIVEEETKKRLTLGKFLQRVREQNGLTLEYVADQLKLKVTTVRELEADSYVNIGSLVYIKGYLRSYARLLHVNIDDQLQSGGESAEAGPNLSESISPKTKKTNLSRINLWGILSVVFVLMVIGVLSYYHYEKHTREEENKTIVKAPVAKPIAAVPAKEILPVVAPVKVDAAVLNNTNDDSDHKAPIAKLTEDATPAPSNPNNLPG